MTTNIRLTYCGMDGEGRTVTEAKREAADKLQAMVRRIRDGLSLVVCGPCAALVHPTAEGWAYSIVTDDGGKVRAGGRLYGTTTGDDDREATIAQAAKHMCDNAWSIDIADDAAFAREMLSPYIAKRDLDRAVAEKVDRCAWQRRARAALDAGYSNSEAHDMACRGIMV